MLNSAMPIYPPISNTVFLPLKYCGSPKVIQLMHSFNIQFTYLIQTQAKISQYPIVELNKNGVD